MTVATLAELLIRIIIAAFVGGCIGYERHNRSKVAGVRTHCIVAMAAAVFTIVSIYGFDGLKADAARVASSVVSGIGFLGAGIIFVRNDTVQGLTTAAGIWATAAVGMAVGSGLYIIGFVAALLIVAIQMIFSHSSYIGDLRLNMGITLQMNINASARLVMDEVEKIGCSVLKARVTNDPDRDDIMVMNLILASAKGVEPKEILSWLGSLPGVQKIHLS